jgi:hypothetical protein
MVKKRVGVVSPNEKLGNFKESNEEIFDSNSKISNNTSPTIVELVFTSYHPLCLSPSKLSQIGD